MPNGPPKRRANRGRAFEVTGAAQRDKATHREGQAQLLRIQERSERSITTAQLRRLPDAGDAVEVQAYLLRREGYNYADICRLLEVGRELARTLVTEGAKACVDEDPITSLRLHLGRLEALVGEWFPRAFVPPVSAEAMAVAEDQGVENPELVGNSVARRNTEMVLKIMAMQESIGTWLAMLPRRGQERKEDDDHAEIKAILLRADEYSEPGGLHSTPHGLPQMDWRPGNVGEGA